MESAQFSIGGDLMLGDPALASTPGQALDGIDLEQAHVLKLPRPKRSQNPTFRGNRGVGGFNGAPPPSNGPEY